jgi:CBS domain-containing protein
MPCQDALIKKALTAKPDQPIEKILKDMKKGGLSLVPVLDDDKRPVGVISLARLLNESLPVALDAGNDLARMTVVIPNAPGMGKRLQRIMDSPAGEIMDRQLRVVYPGTPMEAAIRLLKENAEPVIMVDPEEGAFLGLVTVQSVMDAVAGEI